MSLTSGEWSRFFSSLSVIALLTLIVFVASITLHEAGHLLFGSLMGCTSGKIVLFDSENPTGPYTTLACTQQNQALLGVTGFPLPLIFAVAFFFLGGRERFISYLFFGFGLLLSGIDILLVYNSILATASLSIIGIVVVCIGEVRYISGQINEFEWY